ncbi:putative oxidoreductase YjmC [Ptiloglossa arizonensis]|uniref:putative oxidoreductase YjmC n=1 Tax=Ptiloglossa arizonensis TaxID=3350558 RepID=UPI003FA0602D
MSKTFGSIFTALRIAPRFHADTSKLDGCIARRMNTGRYDDTVVAKEEVIRFISSCLCKAGAPIENARIVAHHLMTSDYRGHFSHGMNRVAMYVQDIENKVTDPIAKPKTVTDFQAIALVNGNNGMGHVIGKFCMELAIEKAKKFGIGMVSARGSNHYGICGYYTMMAIEQDMIGFSCTNTSPLVAPTRSKAKGLGTNPLSLGMGGLDGDQFVLDMATSAVALGKIELAVTKKEPIPEGWALGSDGKITTNPEDAYKASLLMPLGGEERNSGYKGYGLATMVEILCGILAGSKFGPNVRQWKDNNAIADLGQCFIAIDPRAFGTGSKERLSTLLKQLRELPIAGDKSVLVAGDPERTNMARVDKEGGIAYHPNQLKVSEELAKRLGVEPMKLLPKNH